MDPVYAKSTDIRMIFSNPKAQYLSHKKEIDAAISRVLNSGWYILGDEVEKFEKEFASYIGVSHGIGTGSGTEALHTSLVACGIGSGDEVITVPNTFIATAEAIVLAGARPVLVDIDPDTYNMDTSQLEKAINKKTKAILPVHLYGHPADMDPVLEIAGSYGLKVIEDACQAHGAQYQGQRVGSIGNAGCFSFYFTKNLGAYGEGGIITTSDPDIAEKCRMIRDHGQNEKYYHALIGFNGRLDELQAALLKVKLPYLEEWLEKRRSLAQAYNDSLPDRYVKPQEIPWARHVYHLYVIRTPERDRLREWLERNGIGAGMHYPIPIHLQEAWRAYGEGAISLPVTEKITKEIISLPMYPELSFDEVDCICRCIKEFDANNSAVNAGGQS